VARTYAPFPNYVTIYEDKIMKQKRNTEDLKKRIYALTTSSEILSNSEIARRLGCSEGTIRFHLRQMGTKLDKLEELGNKLEKLQTEKSVTVQDNLQPSIPEKIDTVDERKLAIERLKLLSLKAELDNDLKTAIGSTAKVVDVCDSLDTRLGLFDKIDKQYGNNIVAVQINVPESVMLQHPELKKRDPVTGFEYVVSKEIKENKENEQTKDE
jgi:biotin operon repressor